MATMELDLRRTDLGHTFTAAPGCLKVRRPAQLIAYEIKFCCVCEQPSSHAWHGQGGYKHDSGDTGLRDAYSNEM